MYKSDIKILIIEDDETFGKALVRSLSEAGYKAKLVTDALDAESLFKIDDFKAVVIDCMLPKVSGVDLAKKFRELFNEELYISLISGIYRSKTFESEALHKTKANSFFTKPFSPKELISSIDSFFDEIIEEEKDPIFKLLTKTSFTPGEVLDAVEKTPSMHGFDIPLIVGLIHHKKLTGHLNIIAVNQEISSVGFYKGDIVEVQVRDKKSYFGILLVENGFTSEEDVLDGLKVQKGKPLGQILVEANALSPHAIDIIRGQQLSIRLSKIITNTSVEVQFLQSNVQPSSAKMDHHHLVRMMNDWMESKLTYKWLKSFFLPWIEHTVMIGPGIEEYENFSYLSVFQPVPNLLKMIDNRKSIQELLDSSSIYEKETMKALMFMLVTRMIIIDDQKMSPAEFAGQLKRIRKLHKDYQTMDHFEILGLNQQSKSAQAKRAYNELALILHPDKLHPNAPEELRQLVNNVFAKITEAYEIIRDDRKRNAYKRELEMGLADEVLRNEGMFEDARKKLRFRKYQEAIDILTELEDSKAGHPDTRLYLCWAKLKKGSPSNKASGFIKEIRTLMNQIPPEDRHSADYFYVRGLYYKLAGNIKKARLNFKHSATLDPTFTDAKREKVAIDNSMRSEDHQDFTTVVGNLFKRKK